MYFRYILFHNYVCRSSAIVKNSPDMVDVVKNTPRPRHIKTHLLAEFLPDQIWTKKSKIIYITRNPKDVAVSYVHFVRNVYGYSGSNEAFFDAYLTGSSILGPFFNSFYSFWNLRNRSNILFVTYEDMQEDLMAVINKVSQFLGKVYSDDEFKRLADHLSYTKMRGEFHN